MTLETKIKLVDDLIEEFRDITIGEYWEALQKIEAIENNSNMSRGISQTLRAEILKLGETVKSIAEIKAKTGIAMTTIYRVFDKEGIDISEILRLRNDSERIERIEKNEEDRETALSKRLKAAAEFIGPKEDRSNGRPPAEYSNHSPYGIAS